MTATLDKNKTFDNTTFVDLPARDEDKNDITYRLEGILGKAEVLMEAKEGSDRFSLFGVVDDNSQELNDLVMYAPNDCALICLFGSIPADKAVHIIDND